MNLIEIVEQLFSQYGYWVLLVGLPLDFIALPIPPGNSTLTYSGYLAYKGILELIPALLMALAGAILGVTATYGIGFTFGLPLIEKYGRWLSIKPTMVHKTRQYYDKYGNALLLVAFFIPGVRQFIGYFIGIIRAPYRIVLLYAYTGVSLWVIGFFAIGYGFGEQWEHILRLVERYLKVLFIGLGVALIVWLAFKWLRRGK